ncbi:hypothetical protein [Maribacter sp. 2308TA10-17]|uniref:hypothetical protein n=1 Tax=Maribacter sp. 2308TA10-17 TaxID=3386276 RepID=UPI0039BC8E42
MNYIKHMNAVYQQFAKDSRLNTTHISLYMALFQFWNMNRFPEMFHINREEIMCLSKIGGTATYHKCLKNLNDWKYLCYLPSYNPYKGSKIKMFIFETSSEQAENKSKASYEQALIPITNSIKLIENNSKTKLPKSENEVLLFFENKKWPSLEAKKFYNHYNSIGWKLGGKIKITDWYSTAENWMLKAQEIKTANGQSNSEQQNIPIDEDFLKTKKEKNYSEPL